ncbi:MAG: flagellar basal body rod protein FlgB [Gammaproteobacteria bacterium]|nr:flagellar basal body rod protein FlgB [Gammaproteobacteria bacterium]
MLNFDGALGIHPQAVLLRARRAEILAANLANAETPHYQARDLDFSSLLSDQTGDPKLARTNGKHLDLGDAADFGLELKYRVPSQASLDQNTVDVQAERAAFLDNAMRYQASIRFLNSSLSGLLSAFRGD